MTEKAPMETVLKQLKEASRIAARTPPVVLFVHGFLDSLEVWASVRSKLPSNVVTYAVDLAGAGKRVEADGELTLERFAFDVVDAIDLLNAPCVVLVGQSMGAQVAELAAVQRPEIVRGLALLTPVPLAGVSLPEPALAEFTGMGANVEAQLKARYQLGSDLSVDMVERLMDIGLRQKSSVVAAMARAWDGGHPAGKQPSAFQGPVLIAIGELDPFVTRDVIDAGVAPRFSNSTLQVLSGAGHWAHVSKSQAVADALTAFLGTACGQPKNVAEGVQKQGWTDAFAQKTPKAFADAFGENVTLQASTLARPVEGIEQVKAVLAAASGIYESLVFTHEAVNAGRTYLEWTARAFGGEVLDGITVLTKDEEGKVAGIAIHHRPLHGALKFSQTLAQRLTGIISPDYFYKK